MRTVCVYLGAASGSQTSFEEAVIVLAHEIVQRNLVLVYGGSSLGLMGLLANTVKEQGGKVIGVITQNLLDKEKPSDTLDELHIVDSMQDRKKMLQSLADGFVVMPGGLGTLEEAFETWNAIKIGQLDKKIAFLDIDGYFKKLVGFLEHCQENGFVQERHANIPIFQADPRRILSDLS